MIDLEDSPETASELAEAAGIDITGHDRDFTWLAAMVLARIGADIGVERGARAIRRCSGLWYVFNGQVFERKDAELVSNLVRPFLDRCFSRVWKGKGDAEREVRVPLNPTSGTINEVMAAMSGLPGVMSHAEPDQNEDELITENGRVDLATGAVRPHSASVFATRMVPLDLPSESTPELDAARAKWEQYLASLELAPTTLDYLRRAFGYAITGRGSEKAVFFLHGEPNTSKTTLLRIVMSVVGRTSSGGYAADTDCTDWLDRGKFEGGHTDSLMAIEGARLVYGDEMGESTRFNEARVKRAVSGGGGTLRMSRKGEKGRDVPCCFALFFSSNHLPASQDSGMQERLKLITHHKVVENPDKDFTRKFMSEPMRRVILQWLVNAAKDYLESGLGPEPASVMVAREEYAVENDWFGTFVRERIGRRQNVWKGCPPLYSSAIAAELARWCKEYGLMYRVGPNRLPARVAERTGVKPRSLNGRKVFDGLSLRFDTDGHPIDGVVDLEDVPKR